MYLTQQNTITDEALQYSFDALMRVKHHPHQLQTNETTYLIQISSSSLTKIRLNVKFHFLCISSTPRVSLPYSFCYTLLSLMQSGETLWGFSKATGDIRYQGIKFSLITRNKNRAYHWLWYLSWLHFWLYVISKLSRGLRMSLTPGK